MRPRRVLRTALVVVACGSAAVVLYLGVMLLRVTSMGHDRTAVPADAIVVMGAAQYDGVPSEMLERRLQTALALWKAGKAEWLAVTGGKKPGDRFTEAGASAAWLVARGVPEHRILQEGSGRSTWESLSGLKTVLEDSGVRTAVVVTTDWHVARSVYTLRELGLEAHPASAGPAQGSAARWVRETVAVAVGRIIGFGRLHGITG